LAVGTHSFGGVIGADGSFHGFGWVVEANKSG